MLYDVYLANGSIRTYEDKPEVGISGELNCQTAFEVVEELSTEVKFEDVVYAAGVWVRVQPVEESQVSPVEVEGEGRVEMGMA